jgi:hypothetical protein
MLFSKYVVRLEVEDLNKVSDLRNIIKVEIISAQKIFL